MMRACAVFGGRGVRFENPERAIAGIAHKRGAKMQKGKLVMLLRISERLNFGDRNMDGSLTVGFVYNWAALKIAEGVQCENKDFDKMWTEHVDLIDIIDIMQACKEADPSTRAAILDALKTKEVSYADIAADGDRTMCENTVADMIKELENDRSGALFCFGRAFEKARSLQWRAEAGGRRLSLLCG
jgi:hypothetical protein